MDEVLGINSSGEDSAQTQLEISQCMAEVDRLREVMSHDQAEIDRSQVRTRALLAEIKATLNRAGRKAA